MKVKGYKYTYHLGYTKVLDLELLNTKIRIIDSNFDQTGTIYYEGTISKFLKERIPADFLVDILSNLKNQDEISYVLKNDTNIIQKLK